MAKAGDNYIVELKEPHLDWGRVRYTNTRDPIAGEGYIPIPAGDAYRLNLLNSNGTGGHDTFGQNLFYCSSADGFYHGVLRAQGNQDRPNYAKQFSEDGNLRGIGGWYAAVGAEPGDRVCISWIAPDRVVIEKL